MGADCKSAGYAYAGSNPARPIFIYKSKAYCTVQYMYNFAAKSYLSGLFLPNLAKPIYLIGW